MTQTDDIKEIRSIMEKSTRFLSLSGLSGIVAGIIALIGAIFAAWFLNKINSPEILNYFNSVGIIANPIIILSVDALIVLVLSATFGLYFSFRKSKKQQITFWNNASKRMFLNFLIPFITGGIFCLLLIFYKSYFLIIPASLIFYGLALVNCSKYTYNSTMFLGLCDIILGILSAFFIESAIWFWALGFGILHIVYGTIFFFIYDNGTSHK